MPFLHVTAVYPLGQYRLRVAFDNGEVRDVDLSEAMEGEVFEPLREQALFAQAFVDDETRTVA